MEQRVRQFAEVFCELPELVARRVLSTALEELYAKTKQYPIFIEFFSLLIRHKQSFHYTAIILIQFIIDHLSEFDVASSEPPVILTLFKCFSTQLTIAAEEEALFKPYFRVLITNTMYALLHSRTWTFYLDLLFGCFNIFQHNKLDLISQELALIVKPLVLQLSHFIQNCNNPHISERLFEIAYRVPFSLQQMRMCMPQLLSFYVKGLAGPETLQKSGEVGIGGSLQAVSYIESVINHISVEQASYFLQHDPIKSDFIALLNTILHNSPNSNLTSIAITILGRLGGRTRSSLKGTIDLPCLQDASPSLLLHCNAAAGGATVCFDYLLELVVELFQRNLIMDDLKGSIVKLSTSLRCPQENITTMRNIRVAFKRNIIGVLKFSLFRFCRTACSCTPSGVLRLATALQQPATPTPCDLGRQRCIVLLLYAVLLLQEDSEVLPQAQEVVREVVTFFAALFLQCARANASQASLFPTPPVASLQQQHCEYLGPQLPPLPYCMGAPVPGEECGMPAAGVETGNGEAENRVASPLCLLHALMSLLERDDDVCAVTVQGIMQQLHETLAAEGTEERLLVAQLVDEAFFSMVLNRSSEGNLRVRVGQRRAAEL